MAFWKISVRCFFGWLGQKSWYGSIKYLIENVCIKFHWSLIQNNEVKKVWIFFLQVCIQIGRAGWQNNGPTSSKFFRVILGSKTNLYIKFPPNQTIFVAVIHLYIGFLLVNWLGRFALSDSKKIFAVQCINMTSMYTKNPADISKH